MAMPSMMGRTPVQGGDLRNRIVAHLNAQTGGSLVPGGRGAFPPFYGPVTTPGINGDAPQGMGAPDNEGEFIPTGLGSKGGVDPAYGEDGQTPGYSGMIGAGNPARKRRGFRDRFQGVAEVLGPMLLAAGGNPALALQMVQMRQQDRQFGDRMKLDHAQQTRLQQEADWRRDFQSRPQYRTVNGQVVQLDPMGGADPEVIYQAPEDFEIYADAMGLEPGTQEYLDAQQDFVLRAHGPTALQNRTAYEGVRHRNRLGEIDRRESNIRARPPRAPTSRPNPGSIVAEIMDKQRRGERLSSGEEQVLREWQAGRGERNAPGRAGAGGGRPAGRAGQGGANGRQWVTDAQGNRVEAEVRNGQWINVATGRPL